VARPKSDKRPSVPVFRGTFLYDGPNAVQEQISGSPSANMLTGLGTDQVFTRTDSSGTVDFLTDGMNSTFGGGTASGTASTNITQFTGRESDGTGLMYFRTRYYHPGLQRFISQDPLDFGGDDGNLYAFVGNGPTDAGDPMGTTALALPLLGGFGVLVPVLLDVQLIGSAIIGVYAASLAVYKMSRNDNSSSGSNDIVGTQRGGRTFQINRGHSFNRPHKGPNGTTDLRTTGLSPSTIEDAIMDFINKILDDGGTTSTTQEMTVTVDGFQIGFRATDLGNRIGIGTYFLR
jgi:RHS repeat-associated protein